MVSREVVTKEKAQTELEKARRNLKYGIGLNIVSLALPMLGIVLNLAVGNYLTVLIIGGVSIPIFGMVRRAQRNRRETVQLWENALRLAEELPDDSKLMLEKHDE